MRPSPLLTSLLIGFFALIARPVASDGDMVPFSWREADLAFFLPDGWTAALGDETEHAAVSLTDETRHIDLRVYPQTESDDLRGYLNSAITAWGLLPLQYDITHHFGRDSLSADAVDALRTRRGYGFAALLPDDRVFVAFGDTPDPDARFLQSALRTIANSTVFSADAPPVAPGYGILWSMPVSEGDPVALAMGRQNRLFALDPLEGVRQFDATTGSPITLHPFDNPAQATGIAADQQGVIAVSDRACRCIRRMNEEGRWIDSVGSFAGGAPHAVAATPDGILYGIDGDSTEYSLRIIADRETTVSLNFNPAAPPMLAVSPDGVVWVLEWLRSLMDDTISAAISHLDISDSKPEIVLNFWLDDLSPDTVTGFAVEESRIAFAHDQGILLYDDAGNWIDTLIASGTVGITSGDEAIYSLTTAENTGEMITAFSTSAAPLRFGGRTLLDDVPVLGVLNESNPAQSWDFPANAGEVCIHAIDPSRPNEFALGIDMALLLLTPDGAEIAYNDDQSSGDLYGIYDAELCPVAFPQDGTYTVMVQRVEGEGTYTLVANASRVIPLDNALTAAVEGSLQDAAPVERWLFEGKAGQSLTVTMVALSGDLDTLLELYQPDGTFFVSNDDAVDTELGVNAQLTQVQLPADGMYAIEAGRWEGTGAYRLVIVITDP